MIDAEKDNNQQTGLRDDVSIGIATNLKFVKSTTTNEADRLLVFVTLLISAKPGRTTAWIPLDCDDKNDDTSAGFRIEADLSLGLVS